MDIVSVALKRYSTKAFDPTKKLTAEQAEKLKTLLQFSPSSTNSQPWHFIVASTDEGKARVAKSAAGGFVFNERKMLDAFPRSSVLRQNGDGRRVAGARGGSGRERWPLRHP